MNSVHMLAVNVLKSIAIVHLFFRLHLRTAVSSLGDSTKIVYAFFPSHLHHGALLPVKLITLTISGENYKL
jgi:hypothetical protein